MNAVASPPPAAALVLAEALGATWGRNDLDGFVALFHAEGDIVHPYFKAPISPTVAMEVMNAAVKGETRLVSAEVVAGDGDGRQDEILMFFEETGEMIRVAPENVGLMQVRAYVSDRRVQRMVIEGLRIVGRSGGEEIVVTRSARPLTSSEIADRLAGAWGGNDVAAFLGLFSDDAVVNHVLLNRPESPKVVAEVMNCNVKGTTVLTAMALMKGDGQGCDDLVEMEFEETGVEIGFAPGRVGRMSITAEIRDHLVTRLHVHGYQVAQAAAPPEPLGIA